MSAVLGPIHFWLYGKIGNQEELTAALADLAQQNGWMEDAGKFCKVLPPLETVIDEGNIHGWLQAQITDAETRYADLVMQILAGDETRMDALLAGAEQFGEGHAVHSGSPEEVYQAFDDFFVNGMPCDRVNAKTGSDEHHVSWEMTQEIHGQYWHGNSAPYYALRRSVMEGMLKDSGYLLSAADEFHYSIIRK